jgi:hypothetical protein
MGGLQPDLALLLLGLELHFTTQLMVLGLAQSALWFEHSANTVSHFHLPLTE